jgi:hypothetical protein
MLEGGTNGGSGGTAGHDAGGSAGSGGAGGNGGSAGINAGGADSGAGGSGGIPEAGLDAPADGDAAIDSGCTGMTVAAALRPASMLLLIDRSGSMNCNPPPTQTTAECASSPGKKDATKPSKWEISRDALVAALTDLKTHTPQPSVGLALFNNNDLCGYPTTPAPPLAALNDAQLAAITTALNAVTPKGDTPIVGSLFGAYQYLSTQPAGTNKAVVLLTDGDETCDPSSKNNVVTTAGQALSAFAIRTFVLGAPGSEQARSFLSRLAFAGGTPSAPTCDHTSADPTVGNCHVDMTQSGVVYADAIQQALAEVSNATSKCVVDVTGAADPNKVNVVYAPGGGGSQTIPAGSDCNGTASAWHYTDAYKKVIQICGPVCEAIQADPNGKVSLVFGCNTIPK